MKLFVGGQCCHDWTDEPLFPVKEDDPVRHADDCDDSDNCPVSWVNFADKGYSTWWTVCTF